MFGSAPLMLRLGGVVAAGAVVVTAAGCSSGSSSSAPPAGTSSSAPASASASAPASASGSAPASATSPATSPPPSATASGGAATAACTTQHLRAKVTNPNGAAGSVYQSIDFTNTGSAPCTLYGYPGVSLGTGMPFHQVGAAATRSATASPSVVTLQPGQTANALLRVTEALNYPKATCSPAATTYLQIFPPNQTAAIYLPYKSTGCASAAVTLMTIGVVQAGAGGNGQ